MTKPLPRSITSGAKDNVRYCFQCDQSPKITLQTILYGSGQRRTNLDGTCTECGQVIYTPKRNERRTA